MVYLQSERQVLPVLSPFQDTVARGTVRPEGRQTSGSGLGTAGSRTAGDRTDDTDFNNM